MKSTETIFEVHGLGLSGLRAINGDVRKIYSNYNFPNGVNIFKLNVFLMFVYGSGRQLGVNSGSK